MDRDPLAPATPDRDVLAGESFTPAAPPATPAGGGGGTPGAAASAGADLGSLAGGAADDLAAIARDEVQLAKTELQGEVATAASGAAAIGGGAVAGGLGGFFLLLALYEALSRKLPRWAAASLIGLTLTGAAAKLGLGGKATLSRVNLKPEQTLASLRETGAWAKQRLSLGGR